MTRMEQSRFEVSTEGLRKLLEDRGKAFAILELIQNALDAEGVTYVDVRLTPIAGRAEVRIDVEDDSPNGFKDLSHAWTLFAESEKKADPTKRGRWNLGEKLVIALCETAAIETTTGTVRFSAAGRETSRARRKAGSLFTGVVRMTREELQSVLVEVRTILPPSAIAVRLNGEAIPTRPEIRAFEVSLPSVIADADRVLRRTVRLAKVSVHALAPGETARLYELGIPVVETGMPWHVDVHQKVPLNTDRDNVTPSYLRQVHVAVLNAMHEHVAGADMASAAWARDAAASRDVTKEALGRVLDERFGPKRVAYDPKDVEGSHIAVSQGYTVVHGGSLSGEEWARAKDHGLIAPAGQVTPSPKPYSPDGAPLKPLAELTPAMHVRVAFAERYAKELLGVELLHVQVVYEPAWPFLATYSKARGLVLNAATLGAAWWTVPHSEELVLDLLIHEFAHHVASNHLDERYHEACTRLGARSTKLALTNPEMFAL